MGDDRNHGHTGEDRQYQGRRPAGSSLQTPCHHRRPDHVTHGEQGELDGHQAPFSERSGIETCPGAAEEIPPAAEGIAEEPGQELDARRQARAAAARSPACSVDTAISTSSPAAAAQKSSTPTAA